MFVLTSVTSSLSAIIGKSFFTSNQYYVIIPSLIYSILLYGVGYVGNKQHFSITEFSKDMLSADTKNNAKEINTKEVNLSHLKDRVIILLEKKKIFKNPDLKITDVSALLNTNRTYVSRLVNEEFHCSFADFINKYRIDYAKQILQQKEYTHTSISEIGYMSGFSSESSFYRVFKEKEKISPGKFRKNISKNELAKS